VITVEVRGCGSAGDQVFRANSEEEMIVKLRESVRHGTRKIRELSTASKILTQLLLESGKTEIWIMRAVERRLKEQNSN
jgi:hypothetical protein